MKTSEQTVDKTINVSLQEAWTVISSGENVDKWLAPKVTSCHVEGNKRICGTAKGDLIEYIDLVDHDNKSFHYRMPKHHVVPAQNIVAVMKVTETDSGHAHIYWNWKFEVEEEKEAEALKVLAEAGEIGIPGIENYIRSMQTTV